VFFVILLIRVKSSTTGQGEMLWSNAQLIFKKLQKMNMGAD
jgi:hypothetical protein